MIVTVLSKLFTVLMTAIMFLSCLVACSTLRLGVLPVVKVGLIAPFEGPQRTPAYECLFAVKSAIKEYNGTNRDIGPLVELVALNDSLSAGDADKQHIMRQMTIDPAVMGVVGPWMTEAEKNADLARSGSQEVVPPLIVPPPDLNGFASTSRARWAYEATKTLLESIRATYLESELTRQRVDDKLRASR